MRTLKRIKRIIKKILFLSPGPAAKYVYDSSHSIVNDYGEFSGLSIEEIESRINTYKSLTAKEWNDLSASGFKAKSEMFYGISAFYICDILAVNVSKEALKKKLNGFSPLILASIKDHPGRRLLEFGGGTGVFCELAYDMGKDVTYLDIPGQQFEFAKWRFQKYQLPIRMVASQPGKLKLEEKFDIIFTDAVMEHLPDPYTPTAELCRSLEKGGIFVMLVDLSGEEDDMPMHSDVDIVKLHAVLSGAGLANLHGLNQFASIWSKT